MLAVPAETPVTIPVAAPMVAIVGVRLVQTPPDVGFVSVIVEPSHTDAGPLIAPTPETSTVIARVAVFVPHAVVTL